MPPRPKKRSSEPIKSNLFLDALRFLSVVTKEVGPPNETHVFLYNNWAVANNGVLAAGHKIEEDLTAAPNNKLLIEALSKCGSHMSITQLDSGRLSIKSEKFRALVPCVDPGILTWANPDPPCAVIDDRFKEALATVGILANPNADNVVAASVLMAGQSVIATNRVVMYEYWHGIDLPPGLALPKTFVPALTKIDKKLAKFGFSNNSATFYFEDESWLRTQFFAEKWPNVTHILDAKANPFPVPKELFNALDAVAPFTENGLVYFDKDTLRSHDSESAGASFEVPGLPKGPVFNAKQLAMIRSLATSIDFFGGDGRMTMFYGDKVRGAIAGRSS